MQCRSWPTGISKTEWDRGASMFWPKRRPWRSRQQKCQRGTCSYAWSLALGCNTSTQQLPTRSVEDSNYHWVFCYPGPTRNREDLRRSQNCKMLARKSTHLGSWTLITHVDGLFYESCAGSIPGKGVRVSSTGRDNSCWTKKQEPISRSLQSETFYSGMQGQGWFESGQKKDKAKGERAKRLGGTFRKSRWWTTRITWVGGCVKSKSRRPTIQCHFPFHCKIQVPISRRYVHIMALWRQAAPVMQPKYNRGIACGSFTCIFFSRHWWKWRRC